METVHITDYIRDPWIEKEVLGDRLADHASENTAVLLVWHEHITGAYMDRHPGLKGVVRYGVGFDNVDLEAARERGIRVCNTPDYGVDEVSNTALALILASDRGILEYDVLARDLPADWQNNTLPRIRRASEVTVGIIGAGRIGGSLARKAKAVGYRVVIQDPYQPSGIEKMLGVERVDELQDLLKQADIVSVHTPLTDETRGMVNGDFVSRMKQGAAFVNTARGGIIDSVEVFRDGLLSGALSFVGLDVIPEEPPRAAGIIKEWVDQEPYLRGRFVINPHTAYYSQEAYDEMRRSAASNALRILEGKRAKNILV